MRLSQWRRLPPRRCCTAMCSTSRCSSWHAKSKLLCVQLLPGTTGCTGLGEGCCVCRQRRVRVTSQRRCGGNDSRPLSR